VVFEGSKAQFFGEAHWIRFVGEGKSIRRGG